MRGREILDAFLAAHDAAVARTGAHETRLSLAGRGLRFVFAGRALAELNLPAFGHLPREDLPADLEIRAFDTCFSGVPPPLRPWENAPPGRRYEIFGSEPDGTRMTYTADPAALTVWDPARKLAVHWSLAGPDYPVLARASPFHFVLCWWAQDRGAVVVHSAAVGEGGRGILLAGRGGSGKSTTALACLADGFTYAGDDAIWCEPPRSAGEATHGWPLYSTARIFPHDLERLPKLLESVSPERSGDKRVLFLAPRFGGRIAPLRIDALYLPRIDPHAPATVIVESTRASAFRALAPASLDFHPHSGTETLQAIMRLSTGLPSFHLLLGNDRVPAAHVRTILDALPA